MKLTEGELQSLKDKRILEKKIWNFLKELIFYTLFLLVLFAVSYTNSSVSSIKYNQLLTKTFIATNTKRVQFYDVKLANHFKNYF